MLNNSAVSRATELQNMEQGTSEKEGRIDGHEKA
jgi:hypothetical protein